MVLNVCLCNIERLCDLLDLHFLLKIFLMFTGITLSFEVTVNSNLLAEQEESLQVEY